MRTRNPKRRPEWLQVRLVEGPFRQFHGDWRLVPLADQGCKVSFDLSYQPSEGLFDRVAKAALDRIFGSIVEAFVKRAEATLTPLVGRRPRRARRAAEPAARVGAALRGRVGDVVAKRLRRPRCSCVTQARRLPTRSSSARPGRGSTRTGSRPLRQADLAGSAGRVAAGAAGGNRACRWRSACSLSSGRMKPRSPAKPQHSTASTVTTSSLQRPAIATSLSTLPILRTLHTGWTATGSALGRDRHARQHRVVDELDAVLDREAAREVPSSSGRRTGWCRTRSASGRSRSPRAARASSSADFRSAALDEALALERLAAAQAVERRPDRRRRSRPAGTAARATLGSVSRVVAALRAHRARGAAREVDDALGARRGAGARWHEVHRARRAPATTWAIGRPTPCAGRRARPASSACRRRRASGRRRRVRRERRRSTRREVIADGAGDALARAGRARRPRKRLDQQAGLDADRARRRAQAAGGAGVDAVVVVERLASRPRARARRRRRSSRAISRQPTMRWRGDSVRPRDGQFGSQKPHSMHLSTSGRAAGSGFRFFRCASRIVVEDHAGIEQALRVEQRA